jgi:hypothetical protein
MGMRRYLVVLDVDLLAADEELDLEPISYLVARAGTFPVAPQPSHNLGAAAEHRLNLAMRHQVRRA